MVEARSRLVAFRGSELAVFTGMALLQADVVDEINGARWALPTAHTWDAWNGNFVKGGVKKLLSGIRSRHGLPAAGRFR
jgi:hypothetical protein